MILTLVVAFLVFGTVVSAAHAGKCLLHLAQERRRVWKAIRVDEQRSFDALRQLAS